MDRNQLISLRAVVGVLTLASLAMPESQRCFASEQKRDYLYTKFQDGDIPTGQDFATFIDSTLNLVDDGLTLYRIGVSGSTGAALRLEAGEIVGPSLSYAPAATDPSLAPQWAGHFGFLPLEYQDAAGEPHYAFLQMRMDDGPLPPPPGSPGPAIFVEYLVWQTDANVPMSTFVVPEPSGVALAVVGFAGLAVWMRRGVGLAATPPHAGT